MVENNVEKTNKNHKFPHLQNEVDVILHNFDFESQGEFDDMFDEEMQFTHIDTDDVMNGHTKQIRPKVRKSVVQLSKAKELRQREQQEARLRNEHREKREVSSRVEESNSTQALFLVDTEVKVRKGKIKITRIFAFIWKIIRF